MFQGPKGYIGQYFFKVHLQYGDSTTKWPFYTFFQSKFHSIYSLYSLVLRVQRFSSMIENGTIQSLYFYTVQCSTVTQYSLHKKWCTVYLRCTVYIINRIQCIYTYSVLYIQYNSTLQYSAVQYSVNYKQFSTVTQFSAH